MSGVGQLLAVDTNAHGVTELRLDVSPQRLSPLATGEREIPTSPLALASLVGDLSNVDSRSRRAVSTAPAARTKSGADARCSRLSRPAWTTLVTRFDRSTSNRRTVASVTTRAFQMASACGTWTC